MALPDVKKILVVDLGGIGDVLIAVPAVTALRRAYPDAVCDTIVMARVGELARDTGLFGSVYSVGSGISHDLRVIMAARKRRYDLVINMRPITRPAASAKIFALMALLGGRIWAGRNTDGLGRYFHVSIPEPLRALKHDRAYARDLMAALGAVVDDEAIRFPFFAGKSEMVERKLSAAGIGKDSCVVGIHPGGLASHRWPRERFAAVMTALAQKAGCVFVLTGSASERSYCGRLADDAGVEALNLAGELTLKELGALIGRVDLYIANDTGPIHIAAALGRPLIAIFGPGDFARFDPRVIDDKAVVFYKPSACAPCDRRWCRSRRCLDSVTVEEVVTAALRLLGKG